MTYPCHKPGMKKGIATATYILDPMREKAEEIRKSISSHNLERVFNSIVGGYGWQDFMTGQVCADLSYVYDFEDVNTWAPLHRDFNPVRLPLVRVDALVFLTLLNNTYV